jgi:hypothetical protein
MFIAVFHWKFDNYFFPLELDDLIWNDVGKGGFETKN